MPSNLAMVPVSAHSFIKLLVIAYNASPFAICPEIFCRIEAEASNIRNRNSFFAVLCAMSLARVFNHSYVVLFCNPHHLPHVSRLAVQVHWNYSLCFRSYCIFKLFWVHVVSFLVYVNKFRGCSCVGYRLASRYECIWSCYNLVTL